MPVKPPIETKVAQIGRDSIEVRRVVTEDRDRYSRLFAGQSEWLDGIGYVKCELVISALVRANERRAYPKGCGLARALEVQNGSSIRKGIVHRELGAYQP